QNESCVFSNRSSTVGPYFSRALLAGPRAARRRQDTQRRLALLAVTLLRAVRSKSGAGARRLAAGVADEADVGDVDRHLLRQPAPLQVALAAAHVPIDAINALDHDLSLVVQDLKHSAAHAVLAGRHLHCVIHSNMHHTTSLARPTIFMKLRSR